MRHSALKSALYFIAPFAIAAWWVFFVVTLFPSCNTAAKQCRKAEKHMADAIHLCPSIMLPQVKTDTITIYTKPTAIAAGRSYHQFSMDSLFAIASEKVSKYRGEAELAQWKLAQIQKVQKMVCGYAPIDTTDGPCGIRVWEDAGRIRLFHHKASERVDTVYKFVQREVQAKPCPPVSRVRSWPWLAFLLGLVGGVAFMLFMRKSKDE